MTKPIRCGNCGAVMTPSEKDGRTYSCSYCNTTVQAAIDGKQIAAGLALDTRNVEHFLATLAGALQHGFGDAVTVGRDGAVIIAVEIDFEPQRFVVKRDKSKLVASVKKMVRGVALKTKHHPIEAWFALLTEAIAEHVNDNVRVTEVLAQLRGKL